MALGAALWCSSEGESIKINVARQATLYKEFLRTGYFKNKTYKLCNIFNDKDVPEVSESNLRILLFDATDSGLSVDAICEIKDVFSLVIEDAKKLGIELYIIIAANEYELCRGEACFDVNEGKYITFKDYEDYRAFILNSRKKKEERIKKQNIWAQKQKA